MSPLTRPQRPDGRTCFHATIVDLAKSPMLRPTMQHAISLPFASPSAMVLPTSRLAIADETLVIAKQHHRGIVDAIARRQGTRAESLAREHACIARRIFEMGLGDIEPSARRVVDQRVAAGCCQSCR